VVAQRRKQVLRRPHLGVSEPDDDVAGLDARVSRRTTRGDPGDERPARVDDRSKSSSTDG
jgi:hypothetical protein